MRLVSPPQPPSRPLSPPSASPPLQLFLAFFPLIPTTFSTDMTRAFEPGGELVLVSTSFRSAHSGPDLSFLPASFSASSSDGSPRDSFQEERRRRHRSIHFSGRAMCFCWHGNRCVPSSALDRSAQLSLPSRRPPMILPALSCHAIHEIDVPQIFSTFLSPKSASRPSSVRSSPLIHLPSSSLSLISPPVISGTNGEACHLDAEERVAIISASRAALDKAGLEATPLLVGTGGNSARETIKLSREAKAAGADFAIVITPGYFAFVMGKDRKAIADFFIEVADNSPLPIMIVSSRFSSLSWARFSLLRA